MPTSPFDLRIKTIGGTDIGYMLWKDRSGRRTYSVQDASTISPRFLTEEQITQSQLPADIALTFPQTNWRRGIGGIRFEAKDPDVLADGAQVDVTEQGVLKLARENTASTVDSAPDEYVPSGFAVSGTQLWAFIGRDTYSWDFPNKNWDKQTLPFDVPRIYRNGVNFSGNIYVPAWADDAGSSGTYTADDEPVSYLYKTPTAAQWSKVTTAAQTLDGCKYMAIAGQSLWGGYWADATDSGITIDSPTFDAASSSGNETNNTLTFSHTVGARNNRLLVVGTVSLGSSGNYAQGVTYNGVSMSEITAARANIASTSPGSVYLSATMWYLVAPATGANNVVVTHTGSPRVRATAVSLQGVNQSTPVENGASATGTSTTPSVDVTTQDDDWVVDMMSYGATGGATAGASQTEQTEINGGLHSAASSTEEATGTSTTMSWTITSDEWTASAVAVNPVTPITAADTEIPVSSAPTAQFDEGDVIRIESELMLVTARSDTTLSITVVRGYRGSVAATHARLTAIYEVTENPHQVRSAADGTAMANWSTATSVGDSGSPITALVGVGDDLIVIKTDGIYRLEADGTVTNLRPELTAFGHNDFGKGAWAWNDLVFIPLHGGGLWELDTTNWAIRDISFSIVMPDQTQYHGRVVAGHGEPNRLYVMVLEDLSVTSNRQYDVLMTENPATAGINDYNWTMVGSITYATATDGDHAALLLEAITNGTDEHHRLWAGVESTGSNLLPYFITHDSHDDDDEYSSTNGEAYTVAFDAGFPNVLKRAQGIVCNTDNLGSVGGSNHIIEVRYRLEGTGNWLYVNSGTTSNTGNNSTLVGDNQTIAFSQGVTFYKIELRFTLDRKGTGDATTPELHDFALTCQLRPAAVKLLPLSFYLANGLALNNGMVENQAKTKRNQLRYWDTQGAEVVVTDTEGGTRNCVMLPGQMKETEVRNGYHQFPEYKCDVVLAEVG